MSSTVTKKVDRSTAVSLRDHLTESGFESTDAPAYAVYQLRGPGAVVTYYESGKLVLQGKGPELVSTLAWQQNPTRWCSLGNMVATMMLTEAESVRMLSYAGAGDPNSGSMVTSFAGVIE